MKIIKNIKLILLAPLALVIATSCSPTDPKAELKAAHELMLKQDFVAALPKTKICLDMDNDNVDAIIMNAVCAYRTKSDENTRKNATLNLARVTSALAPERFDAWYTLTWVYVQNNDFSQAVTTARHARNLFRQQQKEPAIPPNEQCDGFDVQLAKNSLTYANLLLMYADICRHNKLEEGLAFFNAVLQQTTFQIQPEIPLSYAQLLYDCHLKTYAYNLLKNATALFPNDLPTAYNFAVADWMRRHGYLLKPQQNASLRAQFNRAMNLAKEQGNQEYVQKITPYLNSLN